MDPIQRRTKSMSGVSAWLDPMETRAGSPQLFCVGSDCAQGVRRAESHSISKSVVAKHHSKLKVTRPSLQFLPVRVVLVGRRQGVGDVARAQNNKRAAFLHDVKHCPQHLVLRTRKIVHEDDAVFCKSMPRAQGARNPPAPIYQNHILRWHCIDCANVGTRARCVGVTGHEKAVVGPMSTYRKSTFDGSEPFRIFPAHTLLPSTLVTTTARSAAKRVLLPDPHSK